MTSRRKPIIGVTGPLQKGALLWRCTRFAVWLSGGRAKRITVNTDITFDAVDGVIISGGSDIEPSRYNEADIQTDPSYDPPRDELEIKWIEHAIDAKKPILGICRGMQLINVTRGGTLHQEAGDVLEDFLPNEKLLSKWIGRRTVTINIKSKLFYIMGCYEEYRVNSIHHQAVNRVGEGLKVVAEEKNNLIQAIEASDELEHPFLIGVQWHPELMHHASSARQLFRALVNSTRINRWTML